MKKLWIFVLLAALLPAVSVAADNSAVLRDIAVCVNMGNFVPEQGLQYLESKGHRDLADRIRQDKGFIGYESGYELSGIVVPAMEKARLQSSDEYRMALLSHISLCASVFDYEQADATAEKFLDNVDAHVAASDERTAWQMLVRASRPCYSPILEQWTTTAGLHATQYLMKNSPRMNPALRLLQLTYAEAACIGQLNYMEQRELRKAASDIDRLCAELYPQLPQLLPIREVYHIGARVLTDPESSLLDRLTLTRLLRQGTLDPVETAMLKNMLGNYCLANGNDSEGNALVEESRRALSELIGAQSAYTTLNTNYVTDRMFELALDQSGMITTESDDDSERRRFMELAEEISPTKEGLRCRAAALSPYIAQRTGQTVALPIAEMARIYIGCVKDDPYPPYRYGALSSAYQWLGYGGQTESAISELRNLAGKAESEGYNDEAAYLYRSLASHLYTQGDSSATDADMRAAECFSSSPRPDHYALCDVYSTLTSQFYMCGNHAEALRCAGLADEQRPYMPEDKWLAYTHWQVATVEALLANNPKRELKKLYDRALASGMYDQVMDLGRQLMYIAIAENDYDKAEEYLNTNYGVYSVDPVQYGGHEFADEYLGYLYNIKGDRATWRNAMSTIISIAEQNHTDLNLPFIKLLSDQSGNALRSNNINDASYCYSVILAKSGALMAMIPDDAIFAKYQIISHLIPIQVQYCARLHNVWRMNEKNMTEPQKRQFLAGWDPVERSRQAKDMLEQLMEIQKDYNVTPAQYIDTRVMHITLTSLLDGVEAATAELDQLEREARAMNASDVFDTNTIGIRLDLAYLADDMDTWVSIVDNDAFWRNVDKGIGNIDNMSYTLAGLSRYALDKGELQRAQEISEKRFRLVRDFVSDQYMQLSEAQRASMVDNGTLSAIDIFRQLPRNDNAGLRTMAYDAALFYKNLLLESTNTLRRAVYSSGDSTQIADYERFVYMQKNTDFSKMNVSSPESQRRLREYRALEDSISRRAFDAGLLSLNRSTGMAEVARALAPGEAAIEFTADGERYGALVLRRGDRAPRFVNLISDEALQECMQPLSGSGSKIAPKIKRIYSGSSERGKRLYNELWKPIENELAGIERVYYSPVGGLSTLAIGAIQDSTLTAVCERYDIRLVSSTATLAARKAKKRDSATRQWSAMAIGDVIYEPDPSHRRRNWMYLANSLAEVQHFDSICRSAGLEPQFLRGAEASENAVTALSGNSPSLLLVSTHGFYHRADRAARGSFYINKGLTQDNDSVPANYSIPALKRAGLIFAGANPTWNNDAPAPDENDGILTAEEISRLDLSGTNLLVLSACETGLGDTTMTEGVNGLQRGLKMAGVKSMILSLWEVNDRAGREFMTEFYNGLFSGTERHEAFRQATLTMRHKYRSEPANWAMFVMLD